MMAHTPPDDGIVTQVFPRQRQMPLVGLYLEQRLAAAAETMGRSLVLTNFCLLYTSPSPRDRTRSRMPSSA
jgi:hypothetical protein